MNVKEFLNDDRFITEECKSIRTHPDPEIRKIGRKFIMRRAVRLASGLTLSIQYSSGHYCNAREPFMGGEWDGRGPIPEPKSVEVGFPSSYDRDLAPYAEEAWRPVFRAWRYGFGSWQWKLARFFEWIKVPNYTNTVYGWVPIAVIERMVAKHGGIAHVRSEDYSHWEEVA